MNTDPEGSFENDYSEHQTILWQKGYSIAKAEMTVSQINQLRRDLKAQPLNVPNFPARPSFRIYQETAHWFRVPRHWGNTHFGSPKLNLLKDNLIEPLLWQGKLRDDQLPPYTKAIKQMEEQNTGILSLPTGRGKTFIAIGILAHLRVRSMVVVHTSHLLHQWKKELENAFPTCSIGIVQGSKRELDATHDVVLCMIQTLLNLANIPPIFGFTLIDECHHLSGEVFNTIMFQTQSKYVLGLSATPKRKDGLTNVLTNHLGPVFYHESPQLTGKEGTVHIYHFKGPNIQTDSHAAKISALTSDVSRSNRIVNTVLDLIKNDPDNIRKILVLTERRDHATLIKALLDKKQVSKSVALFLGNVKQKTDIESLKDIIVATYALFSEGVSIPHLNTLVLATPKRDIVQCLGRIFRQKHACEALIYDFADDLFSGQFHDRRKTYKSQLTKVTFDDHGYLD